MTKIAPGGDNISDASQQTAQRMVEKSKEQRAEEEARRKNSSTAEVGRMSFADKKFHVPETAADYEKRVRADRDLRTTLQDEE